MHPPPLLVCCLFSPCLALPCLAFALPCLALAVSANVLFLASTVMVPIGNVAFSLKFVPHHQDLHLSDTLGLLFILTGGDTTLLHWLTSEVLNHGAGVREVLAGAIHVRPILLLLSSYSFCVCGVLLFVLFVFNRLALEKHRYLFAWGRPL